MSATIFFLDAGSCATQDLSFFSTVYGVGTGAAATSDATPVASSPRSIKCTSGTGATTNYAMVEAINIPSNAAGRCSFYLRYTGTPYTAAPGCAFFSIHTVGAITASALSLALNAAGNIVLLDNTLTINSTGSTVLAASTDYRISVTYTTLVSGTNAVKVYINGTLEISATNIPLTSPNVLSYRFGVGMDITPTSASVSIYFAHIYADNGNVASGDTGDIHVTAKRPVANGSLNNFSTRVGSGGSGYGTGHAPQVNEQPPSVANGWSVTSTTTAIVEEYTVEARAVGDINIPASATIVGCAGWATGSASPAASVAFITPVGNFFAAPTTNPYVVCGTISSYPSASNVCGMSTTTVAGTLVSLYDCGILIAYTPALTALVTRSRDQYAIRGILSAPTRPRFLLATVMKSRTTPKEWVRARARSGTQPTYRIRVPLALAGTVSQSIRSVLKSSMRALMQGKSLVRTLNRTQLQVKSLVAAGARGAFSSQAHGHLSVTSPFTLKAVLSTKGKSVQKIRGVIRSLAQISIKSRSILRTVNLAHALSRTRIQQLHQTVSRIRARLVTPLSSHQTSRAQLISRVRATVQIRAQFLAPAWMQSRIRAANQLQATSHFITSALLRFILRGITATRIRSRLATRTRIRCTIAKTTTGVTLMFITFSEVAPTGYNGGIKPNTTIATQLLVTDQNGAPMNGLQQCNVQVTDPAGNSTTHTLGDTIEAITGGKYWCIYNTGSEGVYTEIWSLIAPDGVEIASYKNTFRVEY